MHPTVTGGPLKYFYRLEQLHFHWLSEHSINGVKFPMEIHFVHVRSDLEVSEALNKRDGLAILSVFCNVQTELNEDQQKASEEIMQHIPMLLRTGHRISGVLLNLSKLLSPKRNSYFTYLGSLTSPECNEVVVWIIFDNPIYISDAQYRLFGKVGVGRHNFRSQQKINHHQVFQPPDAFITTPKAILIVSDVLKLMTQFFRNVTRFVVKGLKSRL
ncbi:putative carbonic anhydrase 5 [Melitaea cinxia]|uniref:putative carbonic anhydrase 5 n=1 Tax=Melitaea cinxia TaxID=113334 RepID=UPI001E26F848|nr:putative carbonic anhydrase 5 [Melitaea cinxia]